MYIKINYMVIYCYFSKEIYVNLYFLDVMKIHPTLLKINKQHMTDISKKKHQQV